MAWGQVVISDEYNNTAWPEIQKRLDVATDKLFKNRNSLMYVDFDDDKKAFTSIRPNNEMEKDYKEEIRFAQQVLQWVTPKQ
jgi:hypothetical protein